uniref:CCHC-type domain-containing protein n=1 Tax=Schizaphis graminum TaxID=13262 RepID=A0A2S2P8R8_SCHGA
MDNLNIGSINNCSGLQVNYYGNSRPVPANPRTQKQAVRRCFNCNGYGHIARKCKKSKKKTKGAVGSSGNKPERVAAEAPPGSAAEAPPGASAAEDTTGAVPAEAPGDDPEQGPSTTAEAAKKKNQK